MPQGTGGRNRGVIPTRLQTLTASAGARVAMASVPLPRELPGLAGFEGLASQAVPIAWYPGGPGGGPGRPRQMLVMGIAETELPEALGVVASTDFVLPVASAAPKSAAAWVGPSWRVATVTEKKTGLMMREVNELVLEHAGRRLGLRLGIALAGGGFYWWEWLQVEQLWTGPICTAFRAAGYVGVVELGEDELFDPQKYNSGEWLHKHNWLYTEVYAQVFVNGLVRVCARHVNNRFFDQGRDLEGFVPVIAFAAGTAHLPETALNGQTTDFLLGDATTGVHLDLQRGAGLVSIAHPGRLWSADDLLIYQPYQGTEYLRGEGEPAARWQVKAEEQRLWKGMARSFAFDLSFAPAPIRTCHYLPTYGWLGHSGLLWHGGVLPARGPLEPCCDAQIPAETGNTPAGRKPFCSGRYYEPSVGIDGEYAFGLMQQAYRTGRWDLYEAAIHHGYAFADLGIDHGDFTHQIGGMPQGAISLVLQRNLGVLAAYLETGDPYLLRVAESMADAAYALDRSNWPRRAYGRDAAYIRSLTRLYDVTGQSFYLQRAGEACRRVSQCQRPDGSFADQGGTYGPHAHLNEIIKPWMSSILAEVLVEYLERAGSDAIVEACLVKNAEWLLAVQLKDADGAYWPYQVAWGQNMEDPLSRWTPGKAPRQHPVGDQQLDYNARTLPWLSRRTGDPRYARAWMAAYERGARRAERAKQPYRSTYGVVKIPDNFPWHEAQLWGARWDGGQVIFAPLLELLEVGRAATIELPDGGTLSVRRTPEGVRIEAATGTRTCRQ